MTEHLAEGALPEIRCGAGHVHHSVRSAVACDEEDGEMTPHAEKVRCEHVVTNFVEHMKTGAPYRCQFCKVLLNLDGTPVPLDGVGEQK